MLSAYGIAALQGRDTAVQLSYRDLIANFGKIIESVSRDDSVFPKTLAVNAFRGFLNEFISERKSEEKEGKEKLRFKGCMNVRYHRLIFRIVTIKQTADLVIIGQ